MRRDAVHGRKTGVEQNGFRLRVASEYAATYRAELNTSQIRYMQNQWPDSRINWRALCKFAVAAPDCKQHHWRDTAEFSQPEKVTIIKDEQKQDGRRFFFLAAAKSVANPEPFQKPWTFGIYSRRSSREMH